MNEQLDIEIAILKKNVADQQEEIHNLQMRLKNVREALTVALEDRALFHSEVMLLSARLGEGNPF
jgi:hypothetical protein